MEKWLTDDIYGYFGERAVDCLTILFKTSWRVTRCLRNGGEMY